MIKLFFGLPGSGKTTLLVSIAYKESKRKLKRYKYIYTNFECNVPGVIPINNNVIGHYDLAPDGNALVLVDEATLFADNRDWKNFDYDRLLFFILHRHYFTDIILVSQYFDGVDLRIRRIIDRVYYLQKGKITGLLYSYYYRIPFGIMIPKKNDNGSSSLGEIVSGYYRPSFFNRILSTRRIFRFRYYKFFDSFSKLELPPLPDDYKFSLDQQYLSPDEIARRSEKKKKEKSNYSPLSLNDIK